LTTYTGCGSDLLTDSCGGLSNAEIAGIALGAGAVAGIVIGIAVCGAVTGFGAKRGYDFYQAKARAMTDVQNNPLYEDANRGMENPLYEADAGGSRRNLNHEA